MGKNLVILWFITSIILDILQNSILIQLYLRPPPLKFPALFPTFAGKMFLNMHLYGQK